MVEYSRTGLLGPDGKWTAPGATNGQRYIGEATGSRHGACSGLPQGIGSELHSVLRLIFKVCGGCEL